MFGSFVVSGSVVLTVGHRLCFGGHSSVSLHGVLGFTLVRGGASRRLLEVGGGLRSAESLGGPPV